MADLISQEDMMNILNTCYQNCLNGIPNVSDSVKKLGDYYLDTYKTPEIGCKVMMDNQVKKCTTSGFVTGFGGFMTLPVTLPANLTSVLYIQMRMIACTAYMAGYELDSDETQTFVYACLAGIALNGLIKQATLKFGEKMAVQLIKKIPGKVLVKINQKVGFRFVTKFGTKGIINLGKLVPGVGAVISGSLDYVETQTIANRAYQWFFEQNFNACNQDEEELEITEEDLEEIVVDC